MTWKKLRYKTKHTGYRRVRQYAIERAVREAKARGGSPFLAYLRAKTARINDSWQLTDKIEYSESLIEE